VNLSPRWDDLMPRMMSALAMVVVGGFGLALGGVWLAMLLSLVCGVMIWEAINLLAPAQRERAIGFAGVVGGAFFIATWLPVFSAVILMTVSVAAVHRMLAMQGRMFIAYAGLICAGAMGIFVLQLQAGLLPVLWLVGLVILTDVAGYFAGRIIGGPKFWPSISPKKTWSGTVAGWICAAFLSGLMFWQIPDTHWVVVPLSVVLSAVSQLGDIAESHLKRQAGVKDSSNLIPGHGGFLDRFDGMITAAAALFFVQMLFSPWVGFAAQLNPFFG
jgi:phosphatidate cytidylyltransferase